MKFKEKYNRSLSYSYRIRLENEKKLEELLSRRESLQKEIDKAFNIELFRDLNLTLHKIEVTSGRVSEERDYRHRRTAFEKWDT